MGTRNAKITSSRQLIQDAINPIGIEGKVNHFNASTVTQIEKFLKTKIGETASGVTRIFSKIEWFNTKQFEYSFSLILEHQDGLILSKEGVVWFPLRVALDEKRHPFSLLIAACDKKQVLRETTAALMIRVCSEFTSSGEREDWGEYYSGWGLERLGQHARAIEFYDRAFRRNPHNIDALVYKAYCLGFLGLHEEALEVCAKVLEMDGKSLRAYCYKGFSLAGLGFHKDAIACYDHILQVCKSDADICYNKGVSLGEMGRHEEAVQSYSEALKLNESDQSAWYNKGREFQKLNRRSEALVCFQRAAKLGHEKARLELLKV